MVQQIRVDAKKCGERDKPEASWGYEVIRPLIKHALLYTPLEDQISVEIV